MSKKEKNKKENPWVTPPEHTKEPPVVEPEVTLPREKEVSAPQKDPLPAQESPPLGAPDNDDDD